MDERTTCVVIGGGPAGMVLGLLLARAGVAVQVLEKHGDFLRDFRGDTVHPSTLQLLDELGLGERFAALPHSRLEEIAFPIGADRSVLVGDFRRRRVRHPYIAMVPQWDLLNLLAEAAKEEPAFTLRMNHEVTGLIGEAGRVQGVRYRTQDGSVGEVRADLTVACDGRWSLARRQAALEPREFPVPIDAWWFRLPREPRDNPSALTPRAGKGRFVLVIPRNDFLQLAYIGRKGTDALLRARGIERFRQDVAELVPELTDRVDQLESMDDVKHLDVRLNRLHRWHRDGLLCIGDAAHAMSPVGGVGINLAVQDAVAAATLLAQPLRQGNATPERSRRSATAGCCPPSSSRPCSACCTAAWCCPSSRAADGPTRARAQGARAGPAAQRHPGLPDRGRTATRARTGVQQAAPRLHIATFRGPVHAPSTHDVYVSRRIHDIRIYPSRAAQPSSASNHSHRRARTSNPGHTTSGMNVTGPPPGGVKTMLHPVSGMDGATPVSAALLGGPPQESNSPTGRNCASRDPAGNLTRIQEVLCDG